MTSSCFSGSAMENWHSILRKGLVNASGTKLQVHGAKYGSGIYLSPCADVAIIYSRGEFWMPPFQGPGTSQVRACVFSVVHVPVRHNKSVENFNMFGCLHESAIQLPV